jgi:hypothetical protein
VQVDRVLPATWQWFIGVARASSLFATVAQSRRAAALPAGGSGTGEWRSVRERTMPATRAAALSLGEEAKPSQASRSTGSPRCCAPHARLASGSSLLLAAPGAITVTVPRGQGVARFAHRRSRRSWLCCPFLSGGSEIAYQRSDTDAAPWSAAPLCSLERYLLDVCSTRVTHPATLPSAAATQRAPNAVTAEPRYLPQAQPAVRHHVGPSPRFRQQQRSR